MAVAIATACPGCSTWVQVPDPLRGESVRCPSCDQQFTAPEREILVPPSTNSAPPNTHASAAGMPAADVRPCSECGVVIRKKAAVCPACGVAQPPVLPLAGGPAAESKRVSCGIFAITLGFLGVHKFILGYNDAGGTMLAISLLGGFCTGGMATAVVWIIAVVEGITYLNKSDAEFVQTYQVGKREWY